MYTTCVVKSVPLHEGIRVQCNNGELIMRRTSTRYAMIVTLREISYGQIDFIFSIA